jgi:hypothetical protein
VDRAKPFIEFFREMLARIKPEAKEARDRIKLAMENIEALEFRPLICIDWIKVAEELMFVTDLFPTDMDVGEETNTLLRSIEEYAFMIHDDDTIFFTINSMGIADLTECEKEVLQKLLHPDDAF